MGGYWFHFREAFVLIYSSLRVNDFHQANGYSTDNSPQSRVSDATLINMHPMNGKNGNGTSPAGDNNNSLGLVTNEKPPAARKPRKTRPTDGNVSDGQMATNTPSSPPFNASAMQPGMQDSGAMSAPGTHTSG